MSYRHIIAVLAGVVLLLHVSDRAVTAPETTEPDQEAARTDEGLLKENHIAIDDPGLLDFFRQRTLTDASKEEMERLVRQLGSDSFALREQASRDLLRRGTLALHFLKPALKDPDLEIARRAELCIAEIEQGPGPALPMAAARVLARRQTAGAVQALIGYLPFANDEGIEDEVLNALVALAARQDRIDPALTRATKDAQALRRAAVGFVLGRQKEKEQRAVALPLLTDGDARVRLRSAQGLALGGEKAAVPVLIALLSDGPADLSWRAEEMLQQLAGENAPSVLAAAGNAEARAAWRDAWLGWWKEHSERVDFARLTTKPEQLGLTLFIEWNKNRIWECGRDGKQRWALEVNGPLDAQVLSSNRILVAESGTSRVTERDLKGTIVWEFKVDGEPLNCRRLPNGNTWIGTRNGTLEVSRDGKVISRHQTEGSPYVHGITRLRNGHTLFISSTGLVGELDAAGKKVRSIQLPHEGSWGAVEALPGGRYLVCNYGTGRVMEIDGAGKVLWEQTIPGACGVTRLPNGNTLLGCSDRAVEIDRAGKVLWEKTSDGFVRRAHRR